jgi:NhaP-type Na+/H+ or K+/H+ antiporter
VSMSEAFSALEGYDLLLLLAGLGLVAVAVLPRLLHDQPLTVPILVVGLGIVVWSLPLGLDSPDPVDTHGGIAERLTEVGVITSLMVAGLAIDRPPGWRSWNSTWRLLAITMPLTTGAAALLGWWVAGLVPASAALFGAVCAPTDPVLGKDVEVGAPEEGAEDAETEEHDLTGPGEEDEVRFALSSEAGLNDGLAFPYTNLAIAMAIAGAAPGNWFGSWAVVDVGYKLSVGLLLGWLFGRAFAATILRFPAETELARTMTGMAALGATLVVYGATEFAGGYGFIATFVAAATLRNADRWHDDHRHLETFVEQVERALLVVILALLGGAIARGLLAPLSWELAIVGVLLIVAVRPLAGALALIGLRRSPWRDRAAVSFFGIRGIATFYYLSHAAEEAEFAQLDELWALAGFVVLLSVVVHGVTAAPVLDHLDRAREPEAVDA